MNLAIVGATGNVGRKILEVLEKKKLYIDNLYLLASSKSAGSKINFLGNEYEVIDLENFDFSKAKITFLLLVEKFQKILLKKQRNTRWLLIIQVFIEWIQMFHLWYLK